MLRTLALTAAVAAVAVPAADAGHIHDGPLDVGDPAALIPPKPAVKTLRPARKSVRLSFCERGATLPRARRPSSAASAPCVPNWRHGSSRDTGRQFARGDADARARSFESSRPSRVQGGSTCRSTRSAPAPA